MKVHVMELQVGDRLSADTYNQYGLHILSASTVLSEDDIAKLLRHNIDYVDIELREAAGRPSNGLTQPQELLAARYDDALYAMRNLFDQALSEGRIDEAVVNETFEPLAATFRQETDVVALLLTLENRDEYTYQHCVQVGMISFFIAKWLGMSEEDAVAVGKAGYLHDIGKSRIDLGILNKPGRLSEAELAEMRKHPEFGYDIIVQSIHDDRLALSALEHHERYDRKGYPHGKGAAQLHLYSKIVMVADIYSAMISNRVYQKQRDLLQVLRELHQLSFGEIDPQITHTFIQHMLPNFLGKKIVLSDGSAGSIVMTNPTDYFRPLVYVNEQFMDLSLTSGLSIEKVFV